MTTTPMASFILTIAMTMTLTLGQDTTPTVTYDEENTPTVTFTMEEHKGPNYFLGSLSSVDIGASSNQSQEIKYQFGIEQSLFSINDVSGNLYATVDIDREIECSNKLECVKEFRVITTIQGQFYKSINVRIVIEDINDKSPIFPENTFTLSISEGSTVNSTYPIRNAQDEDSGINSIQSYEINPSSETFGITSSKNLDGSFDVQIYIKKLLDRETKDVYRIRVIARDGGDPQLTGSMYVDIIVLDINDNKPEFNQSVYNVTVQEDAAIDASLLTLHATDKDIGDNGLIKYKISEVQENAADIVKTFSLNSSTGVIRLKEKLVFQPDLYYSFIVEALDSGEHPKVAQAKVFIYVQDTGNNPPTVNLNLGNIGYVNVSENAKNGTYVTLITVEDTDTGPNGIVSCSISNNHFRIVSLGMTSYTIVVNNPLDREIKDLHNVTITCQDQGAQPLTSSASFLVRVTDYNDETPEFEQKTYTGSVFENTMTDQIILQVSATDKDLLENKQIHYEIRNQDKITINRNNGVITVKPFFNRESTPVIIFQVLAIDSGKIPLTGTATVTLTIKDRNDSPPEFLQSLYEFSIEENQSSGTSVGQVAARDADIDENGRFTFSLAEEYLSERLPFIVFANGMIQSNQALDREERAKYDFHVTVRDQGSPSLSNKVPVIVIVDDVNDNKPDLTFPRKGNYSVSTFYPDSTGKIVTHIVASDLDRGENKTLSYRITAGNELGLFDLEPNTGIMFMTDNPNIIDKDTTVVLGVEVRDRGTPSLKSSHDLVVTVTYTNATIVPPADSEPSRYVVISVVVVIVTVVISALIIVVILMLRRIDHKRRALAAKNKSEANNHFANKPTIFITNNSGESSSDYTDSVMERKKKEVSFSLDDHDSLSNYQEFRVSNMPEPATYVADKPPRKNNQDKERELYDKVTTRLESYKLQQMLMENKAKQNQQMHHGNPEDSPSEISGETADSGHGGSEEENISTSPAHDDTKVFDYSLPSKVIPSPSAISPINYNSYVLSPPPSNLVSSIPDDTKVFDYSLPSKVIPSPSAISPINYNSYVLSPPPIPTRTYKPYSSFTSDTNYPSAKYLHNNHHHHHHSDRLNQSSNSGPLSVPQRAFTAYPPVFSSTSTYDYNNDYPSLPSHYRGSVKSRDDDDCSTTTSGSYTLYSVEDLL